jgi:copper chaperone CopZ
MSSVTLHIDGMNCGHCLNAVRQALLSMPGVHVETVRMGRAVVSYDDRAVDLSTIQNAIAEAGYMVTAEPWDRGGQSA